MEGFKLSEATTLNVGLNRYGKVSGELVKGKYGATGLRRLFLHKNEVEAMLMLMPQVNSIVKSDEEGDIRVKLSSDKYVTVSMFRGQKYVGVHTYKDGQRVMGRCMNLNMMEWEKLTSKKEKIAGAMTDSVKMSTDDCILKAVSVTQYKWTIVMKDGSGVKREASQWYFDEETCQADVEQYSIPADQVVFLQCREAKLPVGDSLVKMCYSHIFKRKVQAMQKTNCYGCQVDHPSQLQHLDGCLQDLVEALDKYSDAVYLDIATIDVWGLCRKLLQAAGQPAENGEDYEALPPYSEVRKVLQKEESQFAHMMDAVLEES